MLVTQKSGPPPAISPAADARTEALRKQSRALEAAFLSEMLGYTGLGSTSESFGGGIGEDQFASFLRQEQATAMVAKGGIGLAEQLFHAMTRGGTDAAS